MIILQRVLAPGIALGVVLAGVQPASPQDSTPAITGVVVDDDSGGPLEHTRLWLETTEGVILRLSVSGPDGRFSLQIDSAGAYVVHARRPGYHGESGAPLQVGPEGMSGLEIRLSAQPIEIGGIEVVGRAAVNLLHQDSHAGMYARRNSSRYGARAGPARVMVRSDLAPMDPMPMWRFLEVHGPYRRCSTENTAFYIDGAEVQVFTDGDVDDLTGWPWNAQPHSSVRDWEAVEIYARTSEAPIGLRPVDPFQCSVVALWRHHDPDWP